MRTMRDTKTLSASRVAVVCYFSLTALLKTHRVNLINTDHDKNNGEAEDDVTKVMDQFSINYAMLLILGFSLAGALLRAFWKSMLRSESWRHIIRSQI